jgi:hypothetical protein
MLKLEKGYVELRFSNDLTVITEARLSRLFAIHDNRVPHGKEHAVCYRHARKGNKILTVRILGKHVASGPATKMARVAELLESAYRHLDPDSYLNFETDDNARAGVTYQVNMAKGVAREEYSSRNYSMVLRGEGPVAAAKALLGMHASKVESLTYTHYTTHHPLWQDDCPRGLCRAPFPTIYWIGEGLVRVYDYIETGGEPAARVVCSRGGDAAPTQTDKRNLFWAAVKFLQPLYQPDPVALQVRHPWVADRYQQVPL